MANLSALVVAGEAKPAEPSRTQSQVRPSLISFATLDNAKGVWFTKCHLHPKPREEEWREREGEERREGARDRWERRREKK